jgi:hypothetical protein
VAAAAAARRARPPRGVYTAVIGGGGSVVARLSGEPPGASLMEAAIAPDPAADAADVTARLHDAITAAKNANWDKLIGELIFDSGARRLLVDEAINSIPHPRKFGILHQVAWHGHEPTYTGLVAKGVVFDLNLPTGDGQTAREVAAERSHSRFAAVLEEAAAAAAAQMQMEPEPDAGGDGAAGAEAELVRTESVLVGDKLRALSPAQVAALLRDDLPQVHSPAAPDALQALVHDRCIKHGVDGQKILDIVEANTVPGKSMEQHQVYKQLFDGTDELFAQAITVMRGAQVFATMIINKFILSNASAAINQMEQKVFGAAMIPDAYRNRAFDAWYAPRQLWCISCGQQQYVECECISRHTTSCSPPTGVDGDHMV